MTREDAMRWLTNEKWKNANNKYKKEWNEAFDLAIEALSVANLKSEVESADAEPKMTEEVREALMRLTMCAREECGMCKYKDKCGFEFQYNISTENMNTLLDALSAEAVQGWISCSERLPKKGEVVLITNGKGNVRCGQYRSEHDVRGDTHYWWWKGKTVESVLAWMPLPKPYKGGDDE